LQSRETGSAHDPFEHHAPGDLHIDVGGFQLLRWSKIELFMQSLGAMCGFEVVGERDPCPAFCIAFKTFNFCVFRE
jgi:hypothetical protein